MSARRSHCHLFGVNQENRYENDDAIELQIVVEMQTQLVMPVSLQLVLSLGDQRTVASLVLIYPMLG